MRCDRTPGVLWLVYILDSTRLTRYIISVQITVPQQRLTPLKTAWLSLYQPVTEQLHLDMRMNLKNRKVRLTMPENPFGFPIATAWQVSCVYRLSQSI